MSSTGFQPAEHEGEEPELMEIFTASQWSQFFSDEDLAKAHFLKYLFIWELVVLRVHLV